MTDRKRIQATITAILDAIGFEEVDLALLYPADLFLTKAGDQIIDRLFTVERGGRAYVLRPEFTAAAALKYIDEYQHQGRSDAVRWRFAGETFIDDPMVEHRGFSRHSIGAELIGQMGSDTDSDAIVSALTGINACGISDWQLTTGSSRLLRAVAASYGLDPRTERQLLTDVISHRSTVVERSTPAADWNAFAQMIDADAVIGGRTSAEIAERMRRKDLRLRDSERITAARDHLQAIAEVGGTLEEAFDHLARLTAETPSAAEILDTWRLTLSNVRDRLAPAADAIQLRPALAREWDYYTGITFEVTAKGHKIVGGGRYDELIALLGGVPTPAVGFAYYMDALITILGDEQ